jgi:hypothetical protein
MSMDEKVLKLIYAADTVASLFHSIKEASPNLNIPPFVDIAVKQLEEAVLDVKNQ